jgi:uncharacterized protein
MDVSGNYTLNAPREQVWDALLDPDTLKRTVPGCESLEKTGPDTYAVRLSVGVAGVRGVYDGTLKVLDARQPDTYRVVVDSAGARGILHGDGTLHLEAKDAATTIVHYSGQVQLGGPIASVGTRMAGGAANLLIKQYFGRLANVLPTQPTQPAPPVPETAEPTASAMAAEPMASEPLTPPPPAAPPMTAPAASVMSEAVAPPPESPPEPQPMVEMAEMAEMTAPAAPPPAAPAMPEMSAAASAPETPIVPPAPAAPLPAMPSTAKQSSRTMGTVIAIVVVVIVALIVWFVLGRLG